MGSVKRAFHKTGMSKGMARAKKYYLKIPSHLGEGDNRIVLLTTSTIKRSFAVDPVEIIWVDDPRYWERRHITNESEFGCVAKLNSVYWLQVCVTIEGVPAGRYLAYVRIKCSGNHFFGNWRAGAGPQQYKKVDEPYEAQDETEAVTFTGMCDPDLPIDEWVYVVIGTFQLHSTNAVGISLFGNTRHWTPSILFDHGGLIPVTVMTDEVRLPLGVFSLI